MRVSAIITEVASGMVGFREISQNEAFEHPVFQKALYDRGWRPGMSWCALFAELVYFEVYGQKVSDIFSLSAVQTFYNFKNAGWETSVIPVRGSLAVWQQYRNGVKDWRGHIGIVEMFEKDTLTSIDGNSNADGGRQGIEVARVKRVLNMEENNGLRFLGFIIPKEI